MTPKFVSLPDVARMFGVAPATVGKWFDRGWIRGYRLPGTRHRRISLESVRVFARAHEIPFDDPEASTDVTTDAAGEEPWNPTA